MEKLPRRCKKVGFPVSPGAGARSGRQPPRGLLARIFPEKDVGAVWFHGLPDIVLADTEEAKPWGRRKGEAKTWTG